MDDNNKAQRLTIFFLGIFGGSLLTAALKHAVNFGNYGTEGGYIFGAIVGVLLLLGGMILCMAYLVD